MISLIPMAGRGSRFVQENYSLPKPFIPIMGLPMFVASIKSFPPADKFIFICRKSFLEKYPFEDEARRNFPDCEILSVERVTEGQACTCLLAEPHMDPSKSLLISSIDYQLVYDEVAFERMRVDESIDLVVFTFQTRSITKKNPNAFAYCRVEGDRVVEVVEKRTISDKPELDPAVVGTFYYRRAGDFVRGAKEMIRKDIRVNNEFYVGTSINQLIKENLNVRVFPVDKFVSFGDPFEVHLYQAWEEYFYNEKTHPYHGFK